MRYTYTERVILGFAPSLPTDLSLFYRMKSHNWNSERSWKAFRVDAWETTEMPPPTICSKCNGSAKDVQDFFRLHAAHDRMREAALDAKTAAITDGEPGLQNLDVEKKKTLQTL